MTIYKDAFTASGILSIRCGTKSHQVLAANNNIFLNHQHTIPTSSTMYAATTSTKIDPVY